MRSQDEQPMTCQCCRARPATGQYTLRGDIKNVCAVCLDRWEVDDALNAEITKIIDLEHEDRIDGALARLDAFLEANRYRDHELWVARSVISFRALFLYHAGRLEEAEQACDAWAKLGFADAWGRKEHAFQKALILDELGRYAEGVAVLEDALGYRDAKYLPDDRDLLAKLAELSEKLGQPVDPKWRRLAEKVARRFRTELPIRDTLGESLLALQKLTFDVEPKRPYEWEEHAADDEAP